MSESSGDFVPHPAPKRRLFVTDDEAPAPRNKLANAVQAVLASPKKAVQAVAKALKTKKEGSSVAIGLDDLLDMSEADLLVILEAGQRSKGMSKLVVCHLLNSLSHTYVY